MGVRIVWREPKPYRTENRGFNDDHAISYKDNGGNILEAVRKLTFKCIYLTLTSCSLTRHDTSPPYQNLYQLTQRKAHNPWSTFTQKGMGRRNRKVKTIERRFCKPRYFGIEDDFME